MTPFSTPDADLERRLARRLPLLPWRRSATAFWPPCSRGVVEVAPIQSILAGLCLLVAGVSWAGVLAAVVLVFGIAQVPALTVTLPAIAWVWSRGGTGTGEALIYTAHWLDSGMADNVLKPLMLGPRGPARRLTYLSLVAQARLGPSDVRRMDQRTGFAWRSRSERSFTCGRSGKDRQAWRVRRAVP